MRGVGGRDSGTGLLVHGLKSGVQSARCKVQGVGCRVQSAGCTA